MRILLLSIQYKPDVGGIATHVEALVRFLQGRGHKVYLITLSPLFGQAPIRESDRNLEIHRIRQPLRSVHRRIRYVWVIDLFRIFPLLFLYVMFFLMHHEVEIVHAHDQASATVAVILAKIFGIRTVMSTHGYYKFEQRPVFRLFRLILQKLDAVLALSEGSKLELLNAGVSAEKITIYSHWVDATRYKLPTKERTRKIMGIQSDLVVFFAGRLETSKGVDLLLEVAGRDLSGITFMIAGTGPMEPAIRRAAQETRNVKFLGSLDNQSMALAYRCSDIFALPSRGKEGVPLAVLEALSYGLPVIASRRGGLPTIINERVGLLIEPESGEICRAIKALREDRNRLVILSRNAKRQATSAYSAKNAEVIENVYWNVLEHGPIWPNTGYAAIPR